MTLTDGTELTPRWVSARSPTRPSSPGPVHQVDSAADPAVAGLLNCGVMAGIGATINTGNIGRDDTVAVIGCGGVGDATDRQTALVGAKKIIAVDTDNKTAVGREFGATHTINAKELDAVDTIQDLTDGFLAPTSSSTPSGGRRPGSRRSTPGIWQGTVVLVVFRHRT